MRRILVITLLMVFATGASAREPQCEDCKSTWTQWFGNTAVFMMAEQYAATKIPQLAQLNTWVATQAVTKASLVSTWLVGKYAARFGGAASAPAADSSPVTKDD